MSRTIKNFKTFFFCELGFLHIYKFYLQIIYLKISCSQQKITLRNIFKSENKLSVSISIWGDFEFFSDFRSDLQRCTLFTIFMKIKLHLQNSSIPWIEPFKFLNMSFSVLNELIMSWLTIISVSPKNIPSAFDAFFILFVHTEIIEFNFGMTMSWFLCFWEYL